MMRMRNTAKNAAQKYKSADLSYPPMRYNEAVAASLSVIASIKFHYNSCKRVGSLKLYSLIHA